MSEPLSLRLLDLLSNDAYAATFQTMAQYRAALIRFTAEALHAESAAVPPQPLDEIRIALDEGTRGEVMPSDSATAGAQAPTAGDLLIRAVDEWAEHVPRCQSDNCSACDVHFNQVRLAHKVWRSSRHKSESRQTPEGLCTACSATQYCVEHDPAAVPLREPQPSLEARIAALEAEITRLRERDAYIGPNG